MQSNVLLLIEDETKLSNTLKEYLQMQGYTVLTAASGREALAVFWEKKQQIDLVLLDLMLPDLSGFSVLKEIRKISEAPVIIMSARSTIEDQISGFEKGADDYIIKPYTLGLVKLHIEAVLKRAGKLEEVLEYEALKLNRTTHRVSCDGEIMELTNREFELLEYFMEHTGQLLTRDTILDSVWEYGYVGDVRTVDTLVKQLRKKLHAHSDWIRTVYGAGYIFGEKRG